MRRYRRLTLCYRACAGSCQSHMLRQMFTYHLVSENSFQVLGVCRFFFFLFYSTFRSGSHIIPALLYSYASFFLPADMSRQNVARHFSRQWRLVLGVILGAVNQRLFSGESLGPLGHDWQAKHCVLLQRSAEQGPPGRPTKAPRSARRVRAEVDRA